MKNLAQTAVSPILLGFFSLFVSSVNAQDDGIYEDIRQTPVYEDVKPSGSPLDGYSTYDQDDYYQPQNSSTQNSNNSEQYVDEDGNTYITNNYYQDDSYDYFYASRINRFYRPMYGAGYYDPFYTNMYWYTGNPYYYGTSIYSNWGNGWCYNPWGGGYGMWGGNSWGIGFGFSSWGWGGGWGYSPYCYGGGFGGFNNYYNGYNQGYWNGYYDGLANGNGYYNTYDQNSGIYYGHRGGSGGALGSGLRSTSFADTYNKAAKEGVVSHANRSNVLQTADAKPVVSRSNIDGLNGRNISMTKPVNTNVRNNAEFTKSPNNRVVNTESNRQNVDSKPAIQSTGREVNREFSPATQNRDAISGYTTKPQPARDSQVHTERVSQTQTERVPQTQPQRAPQSYGERKPQAAPVRQQYSNVDRSRQNVNQLPNRSQQPSRGDVYQRGGTPNMSKPSYQSPSNNGRYSSPERVPSRNYSPSPQRPAQRYENSSPSQSQPSRGVAPSQSQPSRNFSAPSRQSSPSPSPSRGGSFSSPGGGSKGGGSNSGGRRGG